MPTFDVRFVLAGSRRSQVMETPTPEQVEDGSGHTLLNVTQLSERLIKAKSDGSLAIATAPLLDFTLLSRNETTGGHNNRMMRCRSLEPISHLSMWSSEATVIELNKQERGLGFSILVSPLLAHDYLLMMTKKKKML